MCRASSSRVMPRASADRSRLWCSKAMRSAASCRGHGGQQQHRRVDNPMSSVRRAADWMGRASTVDAHTAAAARLWPAPC
jgi:hypothetical protein